ncbi:MAG: eCIS core domain-containing protein [Trebonia sp.]
MATLAQVPHSARAPSADAQGLARRPVPSPPQPESDTGRPLDAGVRREMTSLLGHDFAHVRIHDGATAAVATHRLNAAAYTVGHHVVFGAAGGRRDTPEGRALLAHELAHVVQQARGGRRPAGSREAAHEHEASAVAESVLRGTRPPPIRSATGVGIARAPLLPLKLASPDDPPDLTWFDELPGGDAPAWTPEHLVDTIDELEHWKHKQIQTTPTMLRVNRVLAWLDSELARKRKAKPAPLKRGAVRPEQPETLRAHKSIVYTSATALREEIGRIRTYLPYASAGERRILAIELPGLLAQFQNSRAAAEGDRRASEVAQALSQSASGARAELWDMAQRIDTIRPVPGKPGVQALYGAHSVILLSDHEAAALRANLRLALDQAAARVRSVNEDTFTDGSEWIAHNEAHRRVGSVVAWYGRDPIATEEAALDYVVKSNILLNLYYADRGKDLPLTKTALLVVDAAELARTGVEESASAQEHALATAGKWLTALKVSETILTTMVAMEGAEVVGPRAAGFFRGVGLPGAAASVAGGTTTIAVVATADGLLHAVPATLGTRLFGSPDDDLGAVFTDEFWAGAKEGAFAGTSVQATLGFDKLLGVAAGDVSRLGKLRSITAGGLGNATSGLAQSLIERRGLADTTLTGGLDFVVGGAGRGLGFLTRGAPPRVRGSVSTLFGATTSALITAEQGGTAIEIAGAAAQGGALMGKERTADEHAAATARGRRAGEWVRSRAIDVIAATTLNAELPAFRGPGRGGDRIVLTDTAPRPALLSGGPALRAPAPDLFATREQPVAITPAAAEKVTPGRTAAPDPVSLPRPAPGPDDTPAPRPQLLLAAESVKDPGIEAQEKLVAGRADRAADAAEKAAKASARAGEAIAALAQARQELAALTEQARRAAAIAEEARVAAIGAKRNTDVSKAATLARNAAAKADAAVKAAVAAENRAVENRAVTQRQRARKAAAATTAQRRLDTSRRYLDALRQGTVRRRAVVRPPRILTTPNGGHVLDPGFEGRRNDDPSKGHYFSKFPLTDQNFRRMLLGTPPYGADGQRVNLHHRGGEPMGPLDEYRATQHQELGLHKDIEDSRIDRREFDEQRARYWVERARALLKAL